MVGWNLGGFSPIGSAPFLGAMFLEFLIFFPTHFPQKPKFPPPQKKNYLLYINIYIYCGNSHTVVVCVFPI